MKRRKYVATAGAAGLAATAGCLTKVPLVGGYFCGPGDVKVRNINDGGFVGERVEVEGKMDYTLEVGDTGITAFRLDDGTGTIPVYLKPPPASELRVGECVRVEGVVRKATDRNVEGPIIEKGTLL